ncbi:MAG: PIG-L family deacetylase, partial [Candidatus Lokiarchaeota archaeon]
MEEKFSVYYEEGVPIIIPKSIIIFAGHPDDELISCGGTLLKYKELGTNITVIIASIGRGGFAKEKDKDRIEKIRSRECENLQK